jgi:AcrR family transcriptional regulator
VSTSGRGSYHHGDLRAALVHAARDIVEQDGEGQISVREVARRAGVSSAAPYRHFPDKDSLLAAVATHGYHELRERLEAAAADASADAVLAALASAYVAFAVEHPGVYRLMFGHPCTRSDPATSAAAAQTTAVFARYVPEGPHAQGLLLGGWALAHGLATLIIDGKVLATVPHDQLVRTVVSATFADPARRRPAS